MKNEKDQYFAQGPVRLITSLQNITEVWHHQTSSIGSMKYLDTADTCQQKCPVKEPFTTRTYKGKVVRDVLIDTHDLINEPGGFVINMISPDKKSDVKILRIHLGIKEKHRPPGLHTPSSSIRPGTITTTDDYAREVFRIIRSNPQLETVVTILEINDDEDFYEYKLWQEMSPEFLYQFIQTYPVSLAEFHVEMPGISHVYLPEWKFLLDQQVSLKVLRCNFGTTLWTFYQKCILRNSRTLERIILRRLQTYDIANVRFVPFNWNIFAECINMTYLKITCGYRKHLNLHSPHPPFSVFFHENIADLPVQDTFQELHLGNIWVEPCILTEFSEERPQLKVCGSCNDLEYYDEGDKNDDMLVQNGHLQLISISRYAEQVELNPGFRIENNKRSHSERSVDKHLACIVLTLFLIILLALLTAVVFVSFSTNAAKNNSRHDLAKPFQS